MLLDQAVDLIAAVGGDAKQIIGEPTRFLIDTVALAPESAAHLVIVLLAHVCLEQHLQQQFAGFTASPHEWSSVVSPRSSVLGRQSSVLGRQSSVLGRQSSVVGHRSSV